MFAIKDTLMDTLSIMNPFVAGRYISDSYTGLIYHCFRQERIQKNYHIFFIDIYATSNQRKLYICMH